DNSLFRTTNGFWIGSFYFLIVSLLINFFRQVRYKFGERVLRNMFFGKYHRPRVEERVFMFLDLKSSTGLTEELGHENYSRLIKSCFLDLTDIVLKYDAEIYQYVGDEAILTWRVKSSDQYIPFLELYEAYRKKLLNRKVYYFKHFGVQPEFKAGVSKGKVSVTEVGDIKREIAFHGDALNVGSRLCGQCRILERDFVFDATLVLHLSPDCQRDVSAHGPLEVRGRKELVEVMSWSADSSIVQPQLQSV
ncbi:MAG: adenylate/guanylate cyclase domain-containing protein, partial [Bacteroidota bacterium]